MSEEQAKKAPAKTVRNRYQELQEAWKEVKEKHGEYMDEEANSEIEENWISELSQMLDVTEIKTDKYLEEIQRHEQKEMEQKTQEELEMEESRQREIQLKHVKELLVKRDQEGKKFYKSIDTTEKLLETGAKDNPDHVAVALDSALTDKTE